MPSPTRRRTPALLLSAFICVHLWFHCLPAFADTITLRESVRLGPDQREVRLFDVAHLHGELAEALGGLVLAVGDGGRPVTLRLETIRRALAEEGVNLGMVSLIGRECVVRFARPVEDASESERRTERPSEAVKETLPRAEKFIAEPTLRGAVARYVSQTMLRRAPAQVRLEFRGADEAALALDAARYEFEILPQASATSPQIPFLVNVFERQRVVQRVRLTVAVKIEQPVLIVQRPMSRGETIGPDDVVRHIQVIDPHPSEPIETLEAVVGLEARGRLIDGQILRAGDVTTPVAVARNQEVIVRARQGLFVVRMRARALEEGRIGDVIRLRRLSDRVELRAIIDADGQLSVLTDEIMEVQR